jgi:hypothetical protein
LASVKLLQNWIDFGDYFFPYRNNQLLSRVTDLALELEGVLTPPQLNWKYQPIKALFGWREAMRVKGIVSKLKLLSNVQQERLLLTLSPK